ncbi:MAG TPA: flagellar export chaperone FliS [Epulopiscium sp.]|nr:flagellar export chaperone FliS [Candidatus Epulonipiscium sp.]
MTTANAYTAYRNNAVLTSSPHELTLMLYNGAIKFCMQGKQAIEAKNIQEAHRLIMRAQDIIEELQITLDRKYPVSEELDRIYDFILYQLREANMAKSPEHLDIAADFIREIRDTWVQATKPGSKET